jgi:NAD(P)H-nitrite reductase large subunit
MLKLGEKGAIPQRDNETYAIAPHIPCGLLTPELLRRVADVAEKYQVKAALA